MSDAKERLVIVGGDPPSLGLKYSWTHFTGGRMADQSETPRRPAEPEPTTPPPSAETEIATETSATSLPEHPVGTLAIVLIYAALFATAWAWIYFGEFLGRGAPTS